FSRLATSVHPAAVHPMGVFEAGGWIMVLVFVAAYAGIGMDSAACRLHSIAGPAPSGGHP
ncbi:hypothetical protein, partial [Paraburkholderia piptadeniae]|uniref:hypothetical protein n=1 Tax=Paraburkholderia piptadeniae TaxID=1701573 RepID=UPI001C440CC2